MFEVVTKKGWRTKHELPNLQLKTIEKKNQQFIVAALQRNFCELFLCTDIYSINSIEAQPPSLNWPIRENKETDIYPLNYSQQFPD